MGEYAAVEKDQGEFYGGDSRGVEKLTSYERLTENLVRMVVFLDNGGAYLR